tara:strand:+ start:45029 stop:45574 length:546 start_codon:yes stop_codon:yes gene_type:complete
MLYVYKECSWFHAVRKEMYATIQKSPLSIRAHSCIRGSKKQTIIRKLAVMKSVPDKIVFYDGECGFCNRSVQFVLKYQKDQSIHFSPIQSSLTTNIFEKNKWDKPDLSTVYYFEDGKLFQKSDAGLQLSKQLKFPISLLQVFWIIPQFLRDKVYDFIAARRHKLNKGFCVVPTSETKKQFV